MSICSCFFCTSFVWRLVNLIFEFLVYCLLLSITFKPPYSGILDLNFVQVYSQPDEFWFGFGCKTIAINVEPVPPSGESLSVNHFQQCCYMFCRLVFIFELWEIRSELDKLLLITFLTFGEGHCIVFVVLFCIVLNQRHSIAHILSWMR